MTLNAYVVDDEFHAVETLSRYITGTPGLTLLGSSTDPLQAVTELQENMPTVTFLDVNMPGLNGLALGEILKGRTRVVFTTSFRDYGPEAFDLEAADYLLKPISYDRFLACIDKIRSMPSLQPDEPKFFFVKHRDRGKLLKITEMEVLYIEASLNYTLICFREQKVRVYISFKELLEKLSPGHFVQAHRSFLVNLDHVTGLANGKVSLSNHATVPIGRLFRENLLKRLTGQQ